MTSLARVLVLVAAVIAVVPARSFAQVPPVPAPGAQRPAYATDAFDPIDANQLRERLHQVLRLYPPTIAEILQRDPSLLNRPDYLEPYPALVAFLDQHPEVRRNASFFFGQYRDFIANPQREARELFAGILAGVAAFIAVLAALAVVFVVCRELIQYRRWLRQTRVQTDVHTKLLDRMTSNEDLLAYVQSPAGRRFLEAAPIPMDAARSVSAPIGRILWSVQAGVVITALGVGLWLVQPQVIEDIAPGFSIMGTIATALGVGFIISAAVAYLISSRLGLLSPAAAE